MRYSPEQKQHSRAKLVDAGAQLAKKQGFNNTGMDALLAAAGMTTGAFYSQFKTKPELLHAIVQHELEKTLVLFEDKSADELLQALRFYLSRSHILHPEQGCAIPSLGAEIARADQATKETFSAALQRIQHAIEAVLDDADAAWAMICQAVGAVVVARAMATPVQRDQVLGAVYQHAQKVFEAHLRTEDDAAPPSAS
jgi:AcrR family transcriptional regulator